MEAIATGKKARRTALILAGGLALFAFIKFRQSGGEPPPPPPPDPQPEVTTPPFGLVLQNFGYTGSASIYRTQWDENYPRYGVRIRQTSGSRLNLICFLVTPAGQVERIRSYTSVPSGEIKEFSFSANMTIPEQVGTWIAYLYASADATLTNTAYAGKVAQLIDADEQVIT